MGGLYQTAMDTPPASKGIDLNKDGEVIEVERCSNKGSGKDDTNKDFFKITYSEKLRLYKLNGDVFETVYAVPPLMATFLHR